MERMITETMLNRFVITLKEEEKQRNTIDKYYRDVRHFLDYIGENKKITKELVIEYKMYLKENYKVSSANSMIAALNSFLKWAGWADCTVKAFKVQSECFRSTEKELSISDYEKLLVAAQKKGQIWLYLIMLTLCSTGIRISELPYITVKSLSTRQAEVYNKGKRRKVILPVQLCVKLRCYAKQKGINDGSIFVTRNGKNIDRSNIYHAMKKLCVDSNVEKTRVYPHNFRHLFAVHHYKQNRDLSGLASILGHSSINTTRIYTMVTIEQKEKEINALGLVI